MSTLRLALPLLLLVLSFGSPEASARRGTVAWQKTLREVVMSLSSSAVTPPDPARLTMAGLRALKEKRTCVSWRINRGRLELRCGDNDGSDLGVFPPKPGRGVATVLESAVNVAHPRKPVAALTIEHMARELARSIGDPFTNYVPAREIARVSGRGRFTASTGIALQPYQPTEVKSVRYGSDASHQGVMTGDTLVRIGREDADGLTYAELNLRLLGQANTVVLLTLSGDDGRIRKVAVKRTQLPEVTVTSEMLPGNVLYLRVARFSDGVARQIARELWDNQCNGIVLDLRHNGGGVMEEGIALLDLFLSEGKTGGVKPRPGRPEATFTAAQQNTDMAQPLVVLVDDGTASAAELVSLVLKERNRATILGSQTLGKGTMQRPIPMPDGGFLYVTTAHYLGSRGIPLGHDGLSPQRFLPPPKGRTVLDGRPANQDSWVRAALDELSGQGSQRRDLSILYGPER